MKSKFVYIGFSVLLIFGIAAAIFTPKYGAFDFMQNHLQTKQATASAESDYNYETGAQATQPTGNAASETSKGKLIAPISSGSIQTQTKTTVQVCPSGQTGTPPNCKPITTQPTGVTDSSAWNLVLEDDFTAPTIDSSKWITSRISGNTTAFNPNTEDNSFSSDMAEQKNGMLYLSVKQTGPTKYSTGIIQTARQYKYGFYEARLSASSDKGLISTFWLQTNPDGSHTSPFIDIFRYDTTKSSKPNFILSWLGGSYSTEYGVIGIDYTKSGEHTYGIAWNPDGIQLYLDGNAGPTYKTAASIPTSYASVVFNLATLRDAKIDPGTKMAIDYVRIWQH